MLRRPLPLQLILAIAISAIAIALTAAVTLGVGRAAVSRVETEIGRSLATLADQMQDKLDRGIFERLREISNASVIVGKLHDSDPDGLRRWLERLKRSYSDYAWISFIDTSGTVRIATEHMLEGTRVDGALLQRGLKQASASEVHEHPALSELVGEKSSGRMRYLDVTAPVLVGDQTVGMIAAHLSWSWAQEVRDSLFGANSDNSIDILVLSAEGTLLLGPAELEDRIPQLGALTRGADNADRYTVEKWPDGQNYVTGFARSDGYRQYAGFGGVVFAREKQRAAFAPAKLLERQIVLLSLAIVLMAPLMAWWLSTRLAGPLLRLAQAADHVRKGLPDEIPSVGTYAEARMLSRSLRTLVQELQSREARLSELNASLEAQVAERTRRLAEQNHELLAAKQEADRATASKSRFLAAASHDLRQPLHALTLFARALSRRVQGPDAVRLVVQMEEALASLKDMFDALLNVSRLDAGLIQPHLRWVAVADLVERVATGFRAESEQRGITFRALSVPCVVRTDPAILEAMLRNLLSNALKFTQKGGVLVTCRRLGGRICIDVHDTGVGLNPGQVDRIFQEFERSRRTALGLNDGLGLGLSLVRRYGRLLNASVEVRSRPGRGSRFRISMPEPVVDSSMLPVRSERRQIAPLQGRRVLVLDNEPLIVAALARDLTDRGNTVMAAESIAEAEELIRTGPRPEAAIVDISLNSEETGPDFIARIEHDKGFTLPTLVLTGGTDAESLRGLEACGRKWLTKPADPDNIVAFLAEIMHESRMTGRQQVADERETA